MQPPQEKQKSTTPSFKQSSPSKLNNSDSQSDEEHFIGHYHHAPQFMKDNEHITEGYRINFNTPAKILKSLFMVHNESVNIWTHLGAAIFVITFIIYVFLMTTSPIVSDKMLLYKESLNNNLNKYKQSIENLTMSQWWNNFQSMEFGISKSDIFSKYAQISQKLNKNVEFWREQLSNKTSEARNSFTIQFNKSLTEFESIRKDFEIVYLPWVANNIYDRINSTYVEKMKDRLQKLKTLLDSQEFNYLDFGSKSPNPQNISRWPIVVFLLCAFFCLMCSAIFHLFFPMSEKTYSIFLRMDYAGISILIAGSGFPMFYYLMYCNFNWAIFYETISMAGGIIIFIISLSDWFYKPEHLWLKGTSYVLYGSHYLIPISHVLIDKFFFGSYGDKFDFTNCFPWLFLLGLSYIGGAAIYAKRCPQRHYPGKLSICGHSHQIWHCLVILGIIFTYLAVIATYQSRKQAVCPVHLN